MFKNPLYCFSLSFWIITIYPKSFFNIIRHSIMNNPIFTACFMINKFTVFISYTSNSIFIFFSSASSSFLSFPDYKIHTGTWKTRNIQETVTDQGSLKRQGQIKAMWYPGIVPWHRMRMLMGKLVKSK